MKCVIFAALLVVALAAEYPAYPKPSYPEPAYPKQAYPAYPKSYDVPMPFEFAWAVKDEPSYNDYSHQTKSDGKVENGSYRVVLPDGRTQIVTYKADDYGYVADVKYEGEAKYPAYTPAYKANYPAPAYPAPAYPKPAYP